MDKERQDLVEELRVQRALFEDHKGWIDPRRLAHIVKQQQAIVDEAQRRIIYATKRSHDARKKTLESAHKIEAAEEALRLYDNRVMIRRLLRIQKALKKG